MPLESAKDMKVASVELASGNAEAALQVAQKVLAEDPHDALGLVLAGNAQSALGQREVAAASYGEALEHDPDMLDASLGLARLKLADDAPGAAADLQALLKRRPHDARIWTDLGVADDLQSLPAQAQQAYRRAMREDQSLVSAQVDLGLSLALSGKPRDGIALLQPLAGRPDATARIRADLALAEAMAGNTGAAEAVLSRDMPPAQVAGALSGFSTLREATR